jgi:hypothetical protein
MAASRAPLVPLEEQGLRFGVLALAEHRGAEATAE